jgi:hypothetical protein
MLPVIAMIEHMDKTLDHWHKDLVVLLTGQIGREHENQPSGFSHVSVDFVIGADHWQCSLRAGVKVACQNADCSVKATAVHGLGEIECKKDTGKLLALAFAPKLNATLKRIISYERGVNGKLVSDGTLSVCEKNRGAEGDSDPCLCAILGRTEQLCFHDTLENSAPIRVFITGDLACHTCVVGKEGMDSAHCLWCKLKKSKWQADGHDCGVKWTIEELKRIARSLGTNETENGVKSHPPLDCIEIKRFVFPVSHVMLGLANRLLKDTVEHADIVVERTPEVTKAAQEAQVEAQHKTDVTKKEMVD